MKVVKFTNGYYAIHYEQNKYASLYNPRKYKWTVGMDCFYYFCITKSIDTILKTIEKLEGPNTENVRYDYAASENIEQVFSFEEFKKQNSWLKILINRLKN